MASKKSGLLFGGLAILALLLFSGSANAAEPDKEEPGPDPEPEPEPELEPQIDIIVPDPNQPGMNWGVTPEKLIKAFEYAESVSGIPGLGRYLALHAWGAFRAKQAFVTPEQAFVISSQNPQWCEKCKNTSAAEIKASLAAFERVILPKGQTGPNGGTGQLSEPWPQPVDYDGYKKFGSAGLFDILGATGVYAGIHQGYTPLLSRPAANFLDPRSQIFMITYSVYRVLQSPKYKVLVANDPKATWLNVRAAVSYPDSYASGGALAMEARSNAEKRATELGLDLSKNGYPGTAKDFKSKAFWEALGQFSG